jgi:outer membrane protein TolC
MNNKPIKTIAMVLILMLMIAIPGRADEKELALTLEDCIVKALKNNLNVKIEVLNPALSELNVLSARERFLPELSFSFNKRNTENASYSFLDAAGSVKTRFQDISGEISQFLPTGGTLTLSLGSDQYDTNRSFQTINPRYGSDLRLDLRQPLLKNFGLGINQKEIVVAKNNLEMSKSRFMSTLQDTIYNVEEAYWNLVYSIGYMQVMDQSLKLAREQLAKSKRSVEIGNLAPIEVKSAQAEVATREADILQAEANVKNNEDRLKNIINLQAELGAAEVRLVPTDQPSLELKQMEYKQAVGLALSNRPDMRERKIDIKTKKVELTYARNQLLPDLSLTASFWSPGISGTQILYKDGNALTGEVVGTIPGGASDALKNTFEFLYPNWSVGLTLSVPLANIITRSQVAMASVNYRQSQLRLKNQEQQVLLDIRNSLRAVQTNYKRIQAYRLARELTEKKLEGEMQKLQVGTSTNFQVIQFQRDLANARSQELRAVVDYVLSLANQQRVLGISLKEHNVTLKEVLNSKE